MPNRTNRFLASLPAADLQLLAPHLTNYKLAQNDVLFEEDDRIERLYFPTVGVVSVVVPMADGKLVEAGMIGRDGVVGSSAALDGPRALNRALVQIDGEASVIEIGPMRAAIKASDTLRTRLYQHDQLLLVQAQQSAACNALHQIEERFCRWILRTRDLLESDTINLTQEFLSQMLGVRRTSVTLAARHLQALQLIKYRRGQIKITDSEGLHETACECYAAVAAQTKRMFAAWN
jgi:CRP-like cAMP-binding protein